MKKTLAQKVEDLRVAKEKVLAHPMCFKLYDQPHHYFVILPYNCTGLDAVRVAKNNQKLKALETMLKKLEKLWKLDNPVLYPNEQL